MRFLGLVIDLGRHRDRPPKRKAPRETLDLPSAELLSYGDLEQRDEPRKAVVRPETIHVSHDEVPSWLRHVRD